MPQPRESTYAGKKYFNAKELFFMALGVIGAIISLVGLSQPSAQLFFIVGSSLLLAAAIYFKIVYFIALQMILIAGHGALFLGIGSTLQFALPVLLCLQLFVFYYLSGQLNNIIILIGIAGIAILSIGLAYENQWIFFTGSSAVALFALHETRTNKASLLWAILNIIFALIALIKIYLS